MSNKRPQDIWIEQCEAAQCISERFGLQEAFDYLVGEKLINYMEAALHHPEFAKELPRFVSEVRKTFAPQAMRQQLARIEREHAKSAADSAEDDDDAFEEDASMIERRAERFATMKDLLTAPQLGAS